MVAIIGVMATTKRFFDAPLDETVASARRAAEEAAGAL